MTNFLEELKKNITEWGIVASEKAEESNCVELMNFLTLMLLIGRDIFRIFVTKSQI